MAASSRRALLALFLAGVVNWIVFLHTTDLHDLSETVVSAHVSEDFPANPTFTGIAWLGGNFQQNVRVNVLLLARSSPVSMVGRPLLKCLLSDMLVVLIVVARNVGNRSATSWAKISLFLFWLALIANFTSALVLPMYALMRPEVLSNGVIRTSRRAGEIWVDAISIVVGFWLVGLMSFDPSHEGLRQQYGWIAASTAFPLLVIALQVLLTPLHSMITFGLGNVKCVATPSRWITRLTSVILACLASLPYILGHLRLGRSDSEPFRSFWLLQSSEAHNYHGLLRFMKMDYLLTSMWILLVAYHAFPEDFAARKVVKILAVGFGAFSTGPGATLAILDAVYGC